MTIVGSYWYHSPLAVYTVTTVGDRWAVTDIMTPEEYVRTVEWPQLAEIFRECP